MKHWWDRGPVLGMVAWLGLFLLYVAAVIACMLVLYGILRAIGLY
jgi:hypothetical protein